MRRMEETREVIIYSGNILKKAISLPKGSESSNDDELFESIRSCVARKDEEEEEPSKQLASSLNGNALEIFAEDGGDLEASSQPERGGDRQDLKVTSKLFLYSLERKDVIGAIDSALRCTSTDYLDNLVLSFSSFSKPGSLTLDEVGSVWKILEGEVATGKVKMIGLSDVDTQLFIGLHEMASVKPGIVQINLASCCVVPPELAEFCKKNGIQLLTHKDSLDVLPTPKVSELGTLINENCLGFSSTTSKSTPPPKWGPGWVIRIQVHLKTRGVLATKGYVASLTTIP